MLFSNHYDRKRLSNVEAKLIAPFPFPFESFMFPPSTLNPKHETPNPLNTEPEQLPRNQKTEAKKREIAHERDLPRQPGAAAKRTSGLKA